MKSAQAIVVGGGFLLIASCNGIIHHTTKESVTAVVSGKERIVQSSGESTSSKYLIFTDKETFENTDTLWAMKFSSADLYGQIREGETCTFKVTGFRIPFFSSYRNVLSADCEPS